MKKEIDLNKLFESRESLRGNVLNAILQRKKAKQSPSWWMFQQTDWKNVKDRMSEETQIKFELEWRYIYKMPFIAEQERFKPVTKHKDNPMLTAYVLAFYTWLQANQDDDIRFNESTKPLGEHYGIAPHGTIDWIEKTAREALESEPEDQIVQVCEHHPSLDGDQGQDSLTCFMRRQPFDVDVIDIIDCIQKGVMPNVSVRRQDNHAVLAEKNNYAVEGAIIGSRDGKTIYQRQPNGSLKNMTKANLMRQPEEGERA